jgi:hypothetical protein
VKRVLVVTGKHPYAFFGGDMKLVRIDLELLSEIASVKCVALWDDAPADGPIPVEVVPKPKFGIKDGLRSLRSGKSFVHTRFNVPGLVEAIQKSESDVILAEHTYMSEAAFDGSRSDGRPTYITTHVSELASLPTTKALRPIAAIEAGRILRDEQRCATAAAGSACYDEVQAVSLRRGGASNVVRLDMILPPSDHPTPPITPRAIFVGDRTWRPNSEAAAKVAELWPRIAETVPTAELLIVGKPAAEETLASSGTMKVMGFVDDIDKVWAEASVLLAPIDIGGGVRVKILESAANGVPVVGTDTGLGEIGTYLPIQPVANDEEFVEQTARILSDSSLQANLALELWEANQTLWNDGFVQKQLSDWMNL